jgi:hypothetical protein
MPGVYNDYATGYREVIFLVPETVFGVPVHPAATNAAQFLTADISVAHERVNRNDKTSFRSYRERITHRKSGTWSMNLYVLPSGSNLVAPDITDALERGFGTLRAVPNSAVVAGSTTTVINITPTHGLNYQVGDGIGLLNAAGELEISFIKTILVDALTVSPGFSVAPTAAATLYGTTTYKLGNVLSSLTITRILDNITTVYTGAWVNDIAFDFPGDGEATLTIGGGCKEEWASGVSTLAAACLIGDLTITVPAGESYRFEKNTRVLLNAEGANTDEVVLITNVNYTTDVLTITRGQAGTAASAHAITTTVIGPYEPSLTVAGFPITGTKGHFVITGVAGLRTTHETTNHGLTVGNNAQGRNSAIGQESATGFFSTAKRDCGWSTTLWLKKHELAYYNKAKRFVLQEILMQWGRDVGNTWAAKVPNAEFNIPPIDGGGDEEVMLTISGIGLASSIGNDECIVAFC